MTTRAEDLNFAICIMKAYRAEESVGYHLDHPGDRYDDVIKRLEGLSLEVAERDAFYAKQDKADAATKACLDRIGWGCLTPRDNPETKEPK